MANNYSGRNFAGYYRQRTGRSLKNDAYIHGNTVRQIEPEIPERQSPGKDYVKKRKINRDFYVLPGYTKGTMLMLLVVAAVMVSAAAFYIFSQYTVSVQKDEIALLQSEIAGMKEANTVAYNEIESTVDLSEVYDKAVGKMGMVRAEAGDIYTFNNKKSDMVKQYGRIPSSN